MAYRKEEDYSELIERAVAQGDYKAAAQYEQQRNEKIAGEGLDYQQTNRYTGNLDETDYSDILKTQIATGAKREEVADTLEKRNQKISTAENLAPYANDAISRAALDYIRGGEDFSYENAPAYTSKYAAGIERLMGEIFGANYGDWTQGSEYAVLKGNYERQGQKAMQDTLAQVSARTGGMASSYAGNAAQGAYNERMDALEQAALEMYYSDLARKQQNLDLLRGLEADEYGRYRDQIADQRYAAELAYGLERDNLADEWQQKQWDYNVEQDALDEAWRKIQYADQQKQQDWENEFAEKQFNDSSARAWYSLTDDGKDGANDYTTEQYANYQTILNGLTEQAVANESYDPFAYMAKAERTLGTGYYEKLLGPTLYKRLVGELQNFDADAIRQQTNIDDMRAAIYNSDNPMGWLDEPVDKDENGNPIKRVEILTPEELNAALAAIAEWKKVWG